MSFTFLPSEMIEDVTVVSKACAKYLAAGSGQRLLMLATDLGSAVADAAAKGGGDFQWKTKIDSPIEILPSRNWKGSARNFDPLHAIITIDYACRYDRETKRVIVKEGVCVARLRQSDYNESTTSSEKVFHFDAGSGGWQSHDGAVQAGHPPFHMQFYGPINNDIPRLPSMIFYPMDVVTLVILELHQSDWRKHLATSEARSMLRHYPARQNARIVKVLDGWKSKLRTSDGSAFISLQNRMQTPLHL